MLVYNEKKFGYTAITMEELKELANTEKNINLAEVDYNTYEEIKAMFAELGIKVLYHTPALLCGKLLGLIVVK